jgi:hypothetical protein
MTLARLRRTHESHIFAHEGSVTGRDRSIDRSIVIS